MPIDSFPPRRKLSCGSPPDASSLARKCIALHVSFNANHGRPHMTTCVMARLTLQCFALDVCGPVTDSAWSIGIDKSAYIVILKQDPAATLVWIHRIDSNIPLNRYLEILRLPLVIRKYAMSLKSANRYRLIYQRPIELFYK